MTQTKTTRLKNKTSETAKALICLDFGNGEVKLLARLANSKKWARFSFPSFVSETEPTSSSALTVISDDGLKTYLVGENAKNLPLSRTGSAAGRKAEFSNVLFLNALREVFGVSDKEIHCDLIFTAPSIKEYGAEMIAKLEKRHHVQIPASQYVPGSKIQNYVVEIHHAVPMLEGHLAALDIAQKEESPIWVIDFGNRTINCTKIATDGDILDRRVFDESGVYSLAQTLADDGALASVLKTPSAQQVIDVLFSDNGSQHTGAIATALSTIAAPVLAFANDCPRYLIGGGAMLPGALDAFNAQAVDDPQWANIAAIADLSSEILGE